MCSSMKRWRRCVTVAMLLWPNTIAFVAPGSRLGGVSPRCSTARRSHVAVCARPQRRSAQPRPRTGGRLRAGEAIDEAGELERFFFDRAEIFVSSGAGGDGALSSVGTRPAGGNGGKGGDVFVECGSTLNTLSHLPGKQYSGERGRNANHRRTGPNGEDCVLMVPPSTIVKNRDTEEVLGTLVEPGSIKTWLSFQMTLVADVGLVGFPNAGKSTLLRAVTQARPKVADYPFTTLVPNLGVTSLDRFQLDKSMQMVWLDIPGLIEGASDGKGLGLAFLRHTERCKILLHLIDGESEQPECDMQAINRELEQYSSTLANKPQVIILTKTDLPHVSAVLDLKLAALKGATRHNRVIAISSADGANLKKLIQGTYRLLDSTTKAEGRAGASSGAGGRAGTAAGGSAAG